MWEGDCRGEGDLDLNFSLGSLRFAQFAGLLCLSHEILRSFALCTTELRVALVLIVRRTGRPTRRSYSYMPYSVTACLAWLVVVTIKQHLHLETTGLK